MIKSVFKNLMLVLLFLTLFGRITGFLRDQIIAKEFGTTNIADMFMTILSLPQYLSNIFGGVIILCFIPIFIGIQNKKTAEEAEQFSNSIFIILLVLTSTLCVVTFFFSSSLVNVLFHQKYAEIGLVLVRISLPITILMILISFLTTYINAKKSYLLAATSTIIINILVIVFIILFSIEDAIDLTVIFLLSVFLQFIYIFSQAYRNGFRVKLQFKFSQEIKTIVIMGFPTLLGSIFIQSFSIVDKILAKSLQDGSISALSYAYKLTELPLGIFGMTLSTVLFQTLSQFASKNDHENLFVTLIKGIRLIILLTIPCFLAFYIFSQPIVKIVYERGSFNTMSTMLTSKALAAYSFSILATSITLMLTRVFYATQDSKNPIYSSILTALLNLLLSLLLVSKFGYIGLAYSFSIASNFNMLFLMAMYLRKFKIKKDKGFTVFASKISLIILLLMSVFIPIIKFTSNNLFTLIGLLFFMFLGYLILLFVFKIQEVRTTIGKIQKKFEVKGMM